MRTQTILKILLIQLCSAVCFSQTSKPLKKNQALTVKAEEPLTELGTSVAKLDSMSMVLRNTVGSAKKADICFLISRYYSDRLKIDSGLFYSEKIKEFSLLVDYEQGIGKYYLAKSYALFFRNIRDTISLGKAIDIFTKYKDFALLGFAYRIKAKQFTLANELLQARKNFHYAIHFFGINNNLVSLQYVYYELARSFSEVFETDSAVYYLITALQLAEKINDPFRIFSASAKLGELYYFTGDLPNATFYFQYAIGNRSSGVSKILIRNVLSPYIGCLVQQREFKKAEIMLKEYEEINTKITDSWGAAMLNYLRGKFFFYKEDYRVATTHLQLAYDTMTRISPISLESKSIAYFLGRAEFATQQYVLAIPHLLMALNINKQVRFGENVLDANAYISLAYEAAGNKDTALHYSRLYDHLKDSLFTIAKEKAVIELTTRYESEKKEQQIELLERQNQLTAYELKSKTDEIEKQKLIARQNAQQLVLLSQQNEISRLESSEKTLAFENQQKEIERNQKELGLLSKQKQLQSILAAKEAQRKNLAYLAIAIAVLFSAYVFYRFTQNKKLSKQLAISLKELKQTQEQLIRIEKEKEAENLRVRISRDIHDEVGATLSGVALFSEIAKEKMEQFKQKDAMEYLEHISVNSKEMVEKMSDIVWAINPGNDSFERIIEKLEAYSFNICAGKNINLHFNVHDAIRHYQPSMHIKRQLYLVMKEAVNNAIKYSDAKNIWLSILNQANFIIAEVKDDGKGFDLNLVNRGNGLTNIESRAESLHATLGIDSNKDSGTCIRLQFDLHPSGGHFQPV